MESKPPAAASPPDRHYGMDWLRIGAFLLLIFYHIGMFFVHWDWHVKARPVLEWVAVPMLATNAWRIPLLFLVSGYASAAILRKNASRGGGTAGFAWERTKRLLIPVLFGMAVIIPPQVWIDLTGQHGYRRGFLEFWARDYFGFQFISGIAMPTWQHLWFVVYLWLYTLTLALLLAILPRPWRAAIGRAAERALTGWRVLGVPLALLALNLLATWPGHDATHDVINDGPAHVVFFGMFLFGYLLRGGAGVWAGIRAWWKLAAAMALVAYSVVAGVEIVYPGRSVPPDWVIGMFGVARIFQGWCAIVALLGIADRFWNRDHPWRATLTEAVFPFYLIHQTIIVVVAWWCLSTGLGNAESFAVLVATTTLGCWLFYRVGRAIPGVRLLIGLRGWGAPRGRGRPPVPSASASGE